MKIIGERVTVCLGLEGFCKQIPRMSAGDISERSKRGWAGVAGSRGGQIGVGVVDGGW